MDDNQEALRAEGERIANGLRDAVRTGQIIAPTPWVSPVRCDMRQCHTRGATVGWGRLDT